MNYLIAAVLISQINFEPTGAGQSATMVRNYVGQYKISSSYYGSGAFIYADKDKNECYVLTAKHTLKTPNGITTVKTVNNEELGGTIIYTDNELDFAIIKTYYPKNNFTYLKISNDNYPNKKAIFHGFAPGVYWNRTVDPVFNKSNKFIGVISYKGSFSCNGDSGAAIVCDDAIVGIVVGNFDDRISIVESQKILNNIMLYNNKLFNKIKN